VASLGGKGANLMSESDQGRVLLPGQRLRQAREARKLTEAEIAAKMHLSVSYIRALEADDYDRLPEAAFIRGYIKNYAKLVGAPGDELATQFQQMMMEHAPVSTPPPPAASTHDRRLWWIGGAAGLIVALWLLWPQPVHEPAPAPVQAEPEWIEETEFEGWPEHTDDADAMPVSEPATPAPVDTAAADRLEIRFVEDCWLRVRDVDGEEVYVGQRGAAQPLSLQGRGPFRITLGNAAAVSDIVVNGRSVRVPVAAAGQVITVRAP
jgi:cytoskeleton protein RodZ